MDYNSITYGEIISIVKKIGLNLCNDLRLTRQLENDKEYAKHKLGSFCEQYGYPPLSGPSKKK
jgi:hypothetical protein